MTSTTTLTLVILGLLALAVIVIIIYRRKMGGSSSRTISRPEPHRDKSGGIRVRCLPTNSTVPIEKIVWRCSGEHLDESGKACPNHTRHFTLAEMISGYYTEGSGDSAVRKQFLLERLNLPLNLNSKAQEAVFEEFKAARCVLCGRLVVPYCHLTGPEHEHRIYFDQDLSNVICLTGPVASGKTIYLHLLEEYFRKYYVVNYSIPVRLGPYDTRKKIRRSLSEMYNTKKLPDYTTTKEVTPVQFTIGTTGQSWPERPIHLFLHDTSGEIIKEMHLMQKYFGYFSFSHSLVLLIDPYGIPELAQKCRSYGIGLHPEVQDPLMLKNILDDLIDFLGETVYPNHDVFPMNLAIAITKCDEYMYLFHEEYGDKRQGKTLLELLGEVHLPGASKPNFEPLDKISQEFRRWLSQFDNPRQVVTAFIKTAEAKFQKVGFFPVSSLGTRSYYEQQMEAGSVITGTGGFLQETKALDDDPDAVSSFPQPGEDEDLKSNINVIKIRKYEGDLDPLYLDYPILWLYKHI